MNLSGSIQVNLDLNEVIASGLDSGRLSLSRVPKQDFVSGTATNQCDLRWSGSFTLAAGASTTLTVSALTDPLGRSVALRRVKILLVESDATLAGDKLTLGGAATHPWTAIGTFDVLPLGMEAKVGMGDGYPVNPGVSDQLLITNAGTHPITFRLTLAGCSA